MASSEHLTEVGLPIDPHNIQRGCEYVPVLKIGENRYRLTASPGFAPGVANGDEIETAESEPLGYLIVKRGGNICVQMFLRDSNDHISGELADMARSIGGWLDGGMDAKNAHLLVFTFPLATGFQAIESMMETVCSSFNVDKWMYGNVYDVNDGVTPLNWWVMT